MEKGFKTDFDVQYENNSTSNYLVVNPGLDKKLIGYQTQMLLNNKIDGILDFNINYNEQGWNCFYDITSKCTLSSLVSRKQFKRDEFLITLLRILNNIYNIKNYLLQESNILLDCEHIYVEPESMTVSFVYLPFSNYNNDYKTFFINLIINLVKFHNEVSDNYIQKILEIIKSDLFSLSNLKQLIEKLLGDDVKNNNAVEQMPEIKTVKSKPEKKPISKGIVRIPSSTGKNITGKKTDINIKYEILLQIAIIAAFIITAGSSFVKLSENPKSTMVLMFLLFLLVDILIIRIINEQKRKANEKSNYNVLQYISDRMKGLPGVNRSDEEPVSVPTHIPENSIGKDQEEKRQFYHGETVIIKRDSPPELPLLKEKEGEELIKIDKESLLIGRMDNFVDYVINSNAIGKIHAEIMKEGGAYYIMDCNSRNGTFVNGNRLLPNTRNRINNNDEVRFANKEFIFVEAGV